MKIIAGIDIGNSSTETALGKVYENNVEFLSSGIIPTTGIKGTEENISGVIASLNQALKLSLIHIWTLPTICSV